MKAKRFLSLIIAMIFCVSSHAAFASTEPVDEMSNEQLKVFYDDETVIFDVEPIIENGRTLVPVRAIFETMGCAVYYSVDDGKETVSARRADDSLMLTIGENKMYFNGKEIELDVPAKITDGRTLVPLRAISEAFECEVYWYGDTKTIHIYSPANAYVVTSGKLAETITDDEGNVLVEAVAYYPVIENTTAIPCIDKINSDYKQDADKLIEEARAKKEDALNLQKEMGEDFAPFVYELTYEQTYSVWGYLSFTNHKYINVGGAHPTKTMESRTYCTSLEEELAISSVIDESKLGVSLVEYVTNLFVGKFKEITPESADVYTYDYLNEYLGNVQFYITKNSLVLYFNQGEVAPYALGMVSVEIPYNQELFYIDMRYNYEDEHVFEYEYEDGYEWHVVAYAEDKLELAEETIDYSPEDISSENSYVGLKKVTVKGIQKGNAGLILSYVKKGESAENATRFYISSFYVDENNKLTLISEKDGDFLVNENEEQNANVVHPLPETLDINNLDNCTVPVSFEKGGVYVDNSGKTVMDAVVYSCELYDIADIASLKENDVIVRQNEEVTITKLERLESGLVRINGGEENGGFDLISNDSNVYYEVGMNDVKSYYELGKVTLAVSEKFEYADESELDTAAKIYYQDAFLAVDSEFEYDFSPFDTTIVIENGAVVKLIKTYMP